MLSLLSLSRSPSQHIVFLRIVRTACTLHSTNGSTSASASTSTSTSETSCTSQKIAQASLWGECRVALSPLLDGRFKEYSLPYAPVLYREAIQDMTYYCLLHDCTRDRNSLHSEKHFGTYPVHLLLSYLSHPMSEVREGVLLGCQRAPSLIGVMSFPCHRHHHQYLRPQVSRAHSVVAITARTVRFSSYIHTFSTRLDV